MQALDCFDSLIMPECVGIHYKRHRALKSGIVVAREGTWFRPPGSAVRCGVQPSLVDICRKRMRIEEAFRDSKSATMSMGLASARSQSVDRWTEPVLIAALAMVLGGIVGKLGYQRGMQRDHPANTERSRPVLPCVFLGLATLRREVNVDCKEDDLTVVPKAVAATIRQVFRNK